MKAQFLKIAGVTTEKEFYKKFPTEEAFMAKHGKDIKKAQGGVTAQGPAAQSNPYDYYQNNNPYFATNPGTTNLMNPPVGVPQNNQSGGFDPISMVSSLMDPTSIISSVGDTVAGFVGLGSQKKKRDRARQMRKVTDLQAIASGLREDEPERRYVRPEDMNIDPNQLFTSYGVGTNVLAKNGTIVKNSSKGKKSMMNMTTAQEGLDLASIGQGASGFLSRIGGSEILQAAAPLLMNDSPTGQIGGGLAQIAGTLYGGPLVGMGAKLVGNALGGLFNSTGRQIKRDQRAIKKNTNTIMMNQGAAGLQGQYQSYMEDGGSITPYKMGGDLQTHWGGHAETMSYNPYLPANGETVMFRGQAHNESDGRGNTGIGITYGNAPVEVERGEPAVRLSNGGNSVSGEESLTVFGDLKIPDQYVPILGDKNAKGKKFKNYVADLSKQENKQNKIVERSTGVVNETPVVNSFDKLSISTQEANILGANMKLKSIAEKKTNAAHLQNAINETAEEFGLHANKLAQGKVRKAQAGANVFKNISILPGNIDFNTPEQSGNPIFMGSNYEKLWLPKIMKALQDPAMTDRIIKRLENYQGQDFEDVRAKLAKGTTRDEKIKIINDLTLDRKIGPYHNAPLEEINNEIDLYAGLPLNQLGGKGEAPVNGDNSYEVSPHKRSAWADLFNTVLPFIRPTDQEGLNPDQLMGEMYALSNNALEPVQAQSYNPELGTPYDISLQDQLNANQADYRAMQRMAGYNPAAQAILNAQKYEANSKVLGEQFRANQAIRDKVFSENRNTINDAKLKNLSIYDQQYGRQAQAKSNTKATVQAALNSISDKYAKNALENKTLGIYENLYNYRYDNAGRAINMNPLWQPNLPNLYSPEDPLTHRQVKDSKGNIIGYEPIPLQQPTSAPQIPSMATPPYVYDGIGDDSLEQLNVPSQRYGGNTDKRFSQRSIVRGLK